jgi:hypothetical protein
MIIGFGDKVKFIDNEITRKEGIAGKEGSCLGFTTPSITEIAFLGNTTKDYAVSIQLKEDSNILWVTQDLVELIDYGEGQVMEVGNIRATRQSDGTWKEEFIDPSKEKRNWFMNLFKKK